MDGIVVLLGLVLLVLVGLPIVSLALALKARGRLADVRGELDTLASRVRTLEANVATERAEAPLAPMRPVPAPPQRPGPTSPPAAAPPASAMPAVRDAELPGSCDGRPERQSYHPLWDALYRARAWLFGGNTVVRVGVVVLLFGVAFFLNFVIDRSWLPIELRLVLAAVSGMALTAVGWHLRDRRRDYAVVLQGGGIGIVYLTVFAAMNLYGLLAVGPGLALMVVLVTLSSLLAVLQDARSLAVLATAAGFASPLLVPSEGSHVGLFSYYTALNVGIVTVAWFKDWRLLNLLGFVFTFVISAAWGGQYYQPDYFASTEPFLVAFFLLYVAVPVLFATRSVSTAARYMSRSLLFGVPLVAFGLQAGLVARFEYGLAFSALGVGLFYVTLATVLWRRVPDTARILTEAFLALGVAFGTLTIPLAVDGRWTGSAWALEGAGLLWVGVRQRRLLAGMAGVLLQLLAGISFISSTSLPAADVPVLNSAYVGALLVSMAGLFCAWHLHRHPRDLAASISSLSPALLVWGLLWWFGAGLHEITLHVAVADQPAMILVFTAISATVVTWLRERLAWTALAFPPLLQLPIMTIMAVASFADQAHPLGRWSGAAWVLTVGIHYSIQRRLESEWPSPLARYWHAGMLWLLVFLVSWEAAWLMEQAAGTASVWRSVAWALVPGAVLMGLPRLTRRSRWPFAPFADGFLAGLAPLVIELAGWVFLGTFERGDPQPLPYVPLLNPLELTQCLALVILLGVPSRTLQGLSARGRWFWVIALGFVALNGLVARATHFFGGVDFDGAALWSSARYQTAISIIWTVAAMAAMLGARALALRPAWLAGATLLGAVVVKLFLVDLDGVETVARMVSFVVVGLLILLIGYLSPLPPRADEGDPS